MSNVDTLPYKTFLRLKGKYPTKKVVIEDAAIRTMPTIFKDHREFVTHLFAREGIEVTRFAHDYGSLDTRDPKLGVVFLANDSVVQPAIEAWVLIGHNAQYLEKKEANKI